MKKKNLVLAFAGVVALVTGLTVSNAHGSEMCETHRVIAENAMSLRLQGISEEKVVSFMETEIGKVIVAMAYSYDVSGKKSNKIADFGDYVEDSCEGAVSRARASGGVAI